MTMPFYAGYNEVLEKEQVLNEPLVENSREYLEHLEKWLENLPVKNTEEILEKPGESVIISVDLVKGFCGQGPLASPRVAQIIQPIVELMRSCWQKGLRNILLIQDTHEPDALEFSTFPPHCVRGSEEAETVDEIRDLPFFDQIIALPKNSIASGLNTGLNEWLAAHPEITTFIVVGDCTDLCTYQLAMHLRLDANAQQFQRRVIVPVNCVDTYDLPVAIAEEIGGVPHPAQLLHAVFLHHMALNGIEITAGIV